MLESKENTNSTSSHEEQSSNNHIEKPEWLKKLEAESWQPELVVSGVAIFATLSLPQHLITITDFCLATFSEAYFGIISLSQQYVTIIAYLLALNFIAHFVIRVTWIGFLGLSSVYPDGINFAKLPYSDYIKERYKEDFPNIQYMTERLDKYASVIFGFTAGLTMIIVSMYIFFLLLFILIQLIGLALPDGFLKENLFEILGGTFMIIISSASILNLKRFRDNLPLQKFYYRYTQIVGRLIFTFFFKPSQYIVLTFISQVDLKKLSGLYFGYCMFLGLLAGIITSSNDRYFLDIESSFPHFNYTAKSYTVFPDYYENLRPTNKRITWMTLSSDEIEADDFLKVFIPQLGVDKSQLKKTCAEWSTKEDNKREIRMNCFVDLHELYINDSLLNELQFNTYRHPNRDEYGILTYLDVSNLKRGRHILKVERNLGEGEEKRILEVPFWVK